MIIGLFFVPLLVSVAFTDDSSPIQASLIEPKVLLVDELPNLELKIENISNDPLTVVTPVDGSWDHWRYPYLSINVYDNSGKQLPLELAGRCGNMNPLTITDFVRLAPGTSIQIKIGWPFKQHGFQKPGQYSMKLTYDLASPDIKSWQIPGRFSGGTSTKDIETLLQEVPGLTTTSALLGVEVKLIEKSMIEQAIINYFTPKGRSFAFVEKDFAEKKWEVTDIHQSVGHISAVIKFKNNYIPPPRPQYVTPGYWLEQGRYLFIPKNDKIKKVGRINKYIISERFEVYVPKDALEWARRHFDDRIALELGFNINAQQQRQPDWH